MSVPLPARPVLRTDLHLTPDPALPGGACLDDPVSGSSHRLTPIAAQLAACLDGSHTLDEAVAEVSARVGEPVTLEQAHRLLEDLDARMLLDGPETRLRLLAVEAARQRRERLRMGLLGLGRELPEVPRERVSVRDGLRYGCLGCGVCCSGRFRVELNEADEARLAALDLEGTFGRSLEDSIDLALRAGDDPASKSLRKFLRQSDGRCIFLADDLRCEIHARFGYEHKPLGCRIFPFYPVLTPDGGAVLQFRPECSTQHRSAVEAGLVADRIDPIWDELVAGMPLAPSVPPSFELRRDQWSDFRSYRALESRWLDVAARDGWRAALAALGSDLALRPLDDVRSAQQLLAAVWQFHHQRPDRAAETFAQVLGADRFSGGHGDEVDFVRLGAAQLGLLGLFRTDVPGGVARVLADVAAASAALEELDRAGIDRQLGEYVRDFLFGKYAFQGLSVASGVGLMCLVVLATRFTAACASALRGVALDEDLVNEALIAWHTTFFNHDDARLMLLQEWRDALEDVVGLAVEHYA